jgi:hypothetical protein
MPRRIVPHTRRHTLSPELLAMYLRQLDEEEAAITEAASTVMAIEAEQNKRATRRDHLQCAIREFKAYLAGSEELGRSAVLEQEGD